MPLLIDTYNVLHVVGVLPPDLAGIDIDGLVSLIQASRYRQEKVQLIVDGGPSPTPPPSFIGPICIRYAGRGRKADDLIADLIVPIANPATVIVVSTDQQVQRAARKRRCRSMTSEEFLRLIVEDIESQPRRPQPGPPARPARPLADNAVSAWINAFGMNEDEVRKANSDLATSARQSPPPAPAPAPAPAPVPGGAKSDPARAEPIAPAQEPNKGPLGSPMIPPGIIEQAEQLWRKEADDD